MDVQRDYSSAVSLALVSEITDSVLGEREAADAQFRLILLTARAIRVHGPSQVILAYFCLWTARLGGWLCTLNQCSSCGRALQHENAFHSAGHAELYCADCHDDWAKPISKEALAIGLIALSGTLDRLLKADSAIDPTKEILSYALDVLEMHIEKKLISRKTFETGESGIIEI
jgi:recombinational DNA repair protein (RecF pathway)